MADKPSTPPNSTGADGALPPSRELLLWRALSAIFLDSELSVSGYQVIAQALMATGADRATMRRTLIDDVAPHLMGNLQTTAGEWMGWDDDVLLYGMQQAALRRAQPRWPWDKDRRIAAQYARGAWDKIAAHLDNGAGPNNSMR